MKIIKKILIAGAFVLPFSLLSVETAEANPWKINWVTCPPGSVNIKVIRCGLSGSSECFANWQDFCDGSGVGG